MGAHRWRPWPGSILANFATGNLPNLAESVKRHIYTPRPFIWAYNQVSMAFRSKVIARTRKRWQTDGQTDGHPNSILVGPQLLGWGLMKMLILFSFRIHFIWAIYFFNILLVCLSDDTNNRLLLSCVSKQLTFIGLNYRSLIFNTVI